MEHKNIIIGICASKTGFRSGKDTCADSIVGYINKNKNNKNNIYITKISVGDPLKKICADLFGFDVSYCYNNKDKVISHISWPSGNKYGKSGSMNVREILQYFGTDVMRGFNPDFWVHKAKEEIEYGPCGLKNLFIIPDIRYPNELKLADYIIDIERPSLLANKVQGNETTHDSEIALRSLHDLTDKKIFDICNDSSIEDLEKKSIEIFNEILYLSNLEMC